jgi:F420-dependent oxidoreductase-like protein
MRTTLAALLIATLAGIAASAARAPAQGTPAPGASPAHPHILFGIQTGQQDTTFQDIVKVWKEAEALGFDSAWDFDHFMPIRGDRDKPCLEGWTLLSALATYTTKIRIGTLVTGNTYRNPALVAKMATTVDLISNGRVYLGIGAGWFEPDHEAYGFPFYTARERAERLGEALQVITRLWTEDHPSFHGKYYTLVNAPFSPKPIQQPHPPIVVGGQGKKWIMPLVARYADGWDVPIGVSPAGIRKRIQLIHDECRRIGRTPCRIEVSALLVLYSISDVPLAGPAVHLGARLLVGKAVSQSILAGTPQEITARLRAYVDAGVTHFILHIEPPNDPQLLRRFAAEVMPNFR